MDVQNKSQLVHSTERVDSFLGGKLGIIQSTEYFTLSDVCVEHLTYS